MIKLDKDLLAEARAAAAADPERAGRMFEMLVRSEQCDVRLDAETELAIIAYKKWDLDEVMRRTSDVLARALLATPWARGVAGVLLNVVREQRAEVVDEGRLDGAIAACKEAGDAYVAALGLVLAARCCVARADRDEAIRRYAEAEAQYAIAGSMLGGPQVAIEVATVLAESGDSAGAGEAIARGLAHLARYPYGGRSVELLVRKLQATAERYTKLSVEGGD